MYKDYKNFDKDIFSQELCTSLCSETVLVYNNFEENFLGVLNKHSIKKESTSYVTNALMKAIMKRSY